MYLLIVPVKDIDGIRFVFKSSLKQALPDEPIDHAGELSHPGDDEAHPAWKCIARVEDGLARALIPPLWISHTEDHFRVGIPLHELFVEGATRPIDGRPI
jgi:hypothetical protein